MNELYPATKESFGERRLSVELTNICNLHCSYCLRDEDALYNERANFLSLELLQKIIVNARDVMSITHVGFTGGEPTLHPEFDRVVEMCAGSGVSVSFVTNGWHFERIWPTVLAHRESISTVAFSLDGPSQSEHDFWRGEGSFIRLVRAFSRCFGNSIPFGIKVTLRRDVVPKLEQLALFAARMGASYLSFAHVLPTSHDVEDAAMLTADERVRAEQEIANLARIFKMRIALDVGYFNVDKSAPCSPLAGVSANVDYRGCLSLCCNLSGFRGAAGRDDVVGDLNTEDFSSAYEKLSLLAHEQMKMRTNHLTMLAEQGIEPDKYSASPCLFCLNTFGKLPWKNGLNNASTTSRELPVIRARNQVGLATPTSVR